MVTCTLGAAFIADAAQDSLVVGKWQEEASEWPESCALAGETRMRVFHETSTNNNALEYSQLRRANLRIPQYTRSRLWLFQLVDFIMKQLAASGVCHEPVSAPNSR